MNRWQTYVKGNPKRQAILEAALDWVSGGNIDDYMAAHRYDQDITELENHFDTVIDWIDSMFDYTGSEMCGQEWGRLYNTYGKNPYSKDKVTERVAALLADEHINDKRGIIEYVLGGEKDTRLINVRVFPTKIISEVYRQQTTDAMERGVPTVHCGLWARAVTPLASTSKTRWMPTM